MRKLCLVLLGVLLCCSLVGNVITSIEYFFDLDPGPGNGTAIYSYQNSLDINVLIDSATLEPGVHRLYVRAQDDQGIWGMPQSSVFTIPFTNPILTETSVTGLEYWFDLDPGPGNALPLDPRNFISLDQLINARTMRPGVHRLYIRCKNDEGIWSMPQSRAFFVPYMMPTFVERDPVAIEYYFDLDPGPGNATPIALRSFIMADEMINAGDLLPGIHRLYVRTKDSRGRWSLPQSLSFAVTDIALSPTPIASLEYFFDTDPGFGNAIPIPISPAICLDLSISLDAGDLDIGSHRLYIRGQNTRGAWGLPVWCDFDKGIPQTLHLSVINGILHLSWDSVAGAESYKVFSAASPQGPFLEDSSGTMGDQTWSCPVIEDSRFFYLKAVFED